TMQIGALNAESGLKWLAYLQHDRDPSLNEPAKKLATIGALFSRVTTGEEKTKKGNPVEWCNDACRAAILVGSDTRAAFEMLLGLRNNFAHFTPRGWSIEVSGLPRTYALLGYLISRIDQDGWAFRDLNPEERVELTLLLNEIDK
ncbi:MAG: hypothetical protein WCC57_04335, partial [Paracoccaceae bacterium]